jgi:molybdate transport system permease protein
MGLYSQSAMSAIPQFINHSFGKSKTYWLFILPSLVMLLLLGLPVFSIFGKSLGDGFFSYIIAPTAISALHLSLLTSIVSTLLVIATGLPLAYILARWNFRGRILLELLAYLPLVLPPSVAGLGLLMAFGRQGLLGQYLIPLGISLPFTVAAVVMAQTFVAAPLFIHSAKVGFAEVDTQYEEAAYVEGAGEMQLFRFVILPLAWRSILTGTVLTYARALGEFGATILFAGNLVGKTQTMPLAIYLGLERSLGVALALSVLLVLVSILLLGMMRKMGQRQVGL